VGVDVGLDDAVVSGGSLHLVSLPGAFDELVVLPADGWKRTKKGLKYKADDGARVVLVPQKRLKVSLKGPSFPLGDAPPVPIVVSLRVGGRRTCLEVAEGTLNAKRGRFVAKNAAAPATCDEGG